MDTTTFGRNTRTDQHPNGAYPIGWGKRPVGYVDYGTRGALMVWRVWDTRHGSPAFVASAPTLQRARALARDHFNATAPAWTKGDPT
jgi:hypothetical protein